MSELNVYQPKPPAEALIGEDMDGKTSVSDFFGSSLSGHIKNCFNMARYSKQTITERLLRCERQRRGEYDPERMAEIAKTGGTDIYMMITDIKCRAASSWIRDVMANVQGRPFELEPAKDPELPPEIAKSISDLVMYEAQQYFAQGQQIHPETYRLRMQEVHDQVKRRIKEEAREAARRMSDVIEDQLKEGNWDVSLREFIDDYVTYPTAIMKAPVVIRKKRLVWGPNYVPVVVSDFGRMVQRISPYDCYPSQGSSGPMNGYFIERHRLHRSDYEEMMGTPGYSDWALRQVIEHYGVSGFKYYESHDSQEEALKGINPSFGSTSETIEALEFWGKVNGKMLNEWGMRGMDPYKDYEVNAWLVGNFVIRCVLNGDPLGRRPYRTASWGPIPGSFWGMALPEIVRDVQVMCNAAARSLANNMAIASGPQVEVQIDRLPDGEDLTAMYPWKMWQTTSDRTGSGQSAIKFFQPNMNAQELLQIYLQFARQADEVTGIPNYVYGSTQTGGAGRTASGLNMLMDNAAKGIKMAVVTIDEVIVGVVNQYYTHNMMFNQDPYIKGDFKVVARGALGLIAKEQLMQRRSEFLMSTANPVDMGIIGVKGRGYLLREQAHSLGLNTDKIIPDVDMIEDQSGGIPPEVQAQLQQQEQQTAQIMQKAQETLAKKEDDITRLEQALAKLEVDVRNRQEEFRVKVREIDSDNSKIDKQVDAKRYEVDKRFEAEKYKADKQAEAAAKQSESVAKQPATKEQPNKQPQIVVNSDNAPIAEAIKASSESTAKIVEQLSKTMAKTNEALATAVANISKPKSANITLTKKADGSVTGKRTEE